MRNDIKYFNRELSWAHFNLRVLDQALDPKKPLLERLKFLAIVSSNFDEFFMVRVSRLVREAANGDIVNCPSGAKPSQVLSKLIKMIQEMVTKQYDCLLKTIIPELKKKGMTICFEKDFSDEDLQLLQAIFEEEIFAALTPLAVDHKKRLPLTGDQGQYLAFTITNEKDEKKEEHLAVVRMPENLDRFYSLPAPKNELRYALLEDIILNSADLLFPGYEIKESACFRVTRDADLEVDEDDDRDFMQAMEEILINRQTSFPVRLEINTKSPRLMNMLIDKLSLDKSKVFKIAGPLHLKQFMSLAFVPGFEKLKEPEWQAQPPVDIPLESDIFEVLKRQDILLHHPYESFDPVVDMISQAASDKKVIAIKMTLYRTSGRSPIVKALAKAAANGKQVAVLVELKARFDEEQNIEWAKQLEKAGVTVVYGIANLKVHAKAVLIVRREPEGTKKYVHLGTGNYNDTTARLYTDIGLMTSREDISFEVTLFFNCITGFSTVTDLEKLTMAPYGLRSKIKYLIDREIDHHQTVGNGLIIVKMNSLVDPEVIDWLYYASQNGVKILLNVRGICCLRPGVVGLSDKIRVVSIIDRYLEHTRAFYFYNGGDEEVYLSSADWMGRNINRRIELFFPVESKKHKNRVLKIMESYFKDNVSSYELNKDGVYERITKTEAKNKFRTQDQMHKDAVKSADKLAAEQIKELKVRKKLKKNK